MNFGVLYQRRAHEGSRTKSARISELVLDRYALIKFGCTVGANSRRCRGSFCTGIELRCEEGMCLSIFRQVFMRRTVCAFGSWSR
jgi:hypothetical protein